MPQREGRSARLLLWRVERIALRADTRTTEGGTLVTPRLDHFVGRGLNVGRTAERVEPFDGVHVFQGEIPPSPLFLAKQVHDGEPFMLTAIADWHTAWTSGGVPCPVLSLRCLGQKRGCVRGVSSPDALVV